MSSRKANGSKTTNMPGNLIGFLCVERHLADWSHRINYMNFRRHELFPNVIFPNWDWRNNPKRNNPEKELS